MLVLAQLLKFIAAHHVYNIILAAMPIDPDILRKG
jgi:hypothetical protein